jgi:hypothetical protein
MSGGIEASDAHVMCSLFARHRRQNCRRRLIISPALDRAQNRDGRVAIAGDVGNVVWRAAMAAS